MKVFVIDRSPNGGNGNIATIKMSVVPNVGDQFMIGVDGERREYVVRGRRFVVRKRTTQVKLKTGEWREVNKDKVSAMALFVVSAEAFAKELQAIDEHQN